MKIDRRGRSYATWIVAGGDEEMSFDVTFDNSNWYPTEFVGVVTETFPDLGIVVTGLSIRVLVAGPDTEYWLGAIPLPLGTNKAKLRVTDAPEIIIQNAGSVTVT